MTDDGTTWPPEIYRTAEPIRTGLARLEGNERLDAVSQMLEPLAKKVNEGSLGHILRGDWLGHALHPLLTDVPLGCWTAAAVLDVFGGRRSRSAATRLVGFGLLAVPPTVASGVAEFGSIEERSARRVGAAHATGNVAVAVMYLLSWRARRRGHHLRGVAWGLGGGGLALVTGYLGGHLSLALAVGTGRRGLDVDRPSVQPLDHDVSDPGITLFEAADTAGVPIGLQGEYEPSPSEWVRKQVETYERTGGREANTLMDTGRPVIIVTTRGNKTGKIRKTPLMRVEHDGEYALVASKGGAPEHPQWYHNLTANPSDVMLQDGPEPFAADAREVDGDERAAWWSRAVAAYPPYAEYQEKTDRLIPVLVATRRPT